MSDQEKIDQTIAYAEEHAVIAANYPKNVPLSAWLTDFLFFSTRVGYSVSGQYSISHQEHHLKYLSSIAVRCKAWLEAKGVHIGWAPIRFEYSEKKCVLEDLEKCDETEINEEDLFLTLNMCIGQIVEALYDEDEAVGDYIAVLAVLALAWINRLLKREEQEK